MSKLRILLVTVFVHVGATTFADDADLKGVDEECIDASRSGVVSIVTCFDGMIERGVSPIILAVAAEAGGEFHLKERNFDLALAAYQAGIHFAPDYYPLYSKKRALQNEVRSAFIGEPAGILEFASRGLEWQPDDPELIALRGLSLFRMGNLDRAMADLDNAIQLTSYPHLFYLQRAQIFSDLGQFEDALDDVDLVVDDVLDNEKLRARILYDEVNSNGYVRAQALLWRENLPATQIAALKMQAEINTEVGDFGAALAAYRQLAILSPQNIRYLVLIARLHLQLDAILDAIIVYDRAILMIIESELAEVRSLEPRIRFERAAALATAGSFDAAMLDFDFSLPRIAVEERKRLQTTLIDAGYLSGEVDGFYDEEFKVAVRLCLADPAC